MTAKTSKLLHHMVSGAGYGFFFGVLGNVFMFLFGIFVARALGPANYGVYSLGETVLKVVTVIVAMGIPEAIPRFIPLYLQKKKQLLSGYMHFTKSFLVYSSIIFSSILFFLAPSLASFFDGGNELVLILRIICLIIPIKVGATFLKRLCVATKNFKFREIAYHLIERGLILVVGLLVIFFNLNVVLLFLGILGVHLVALVYLLVIYYTKISLKLSKEKKYDFSLWLKFSLPLFFTNVFAFFISWSDNIVIAKFLPFENLGLYAVAFSIAYQLTFFQTIFGTSFLPIISEAKAANDNELVKRFFKRTSAWVFGLTFPIFVIIMLFSKQILSFLYGNAYLGSSVALQIVSLGMLINIGLGLVSSIIILHNKTWVHFVVNSSLAVGNIILNILLVPKLGIMGAAISTAISTALVNIVFFLVAKKLENISLDRIFIQKFLLVGVVSYLITKFLTNFGLPDVIQFLVSLGIFGVIFVIGVYLAKPFVKEDEDVLKYIESVTKINLNLLRKYMQINK